MNQQDGRIYDGILSSIYYDVKNPSSFSSAKKLFSAANLINKNITKELTENWLSKQKTYNSSNRQKKIQKKSYHCAEN